MKIQNIGNSKFIFLEGEVNPNQVIELGKEKAKEILDAYKNDFIALEELEVVNAAKPSASKPKSQKDIAVKVETAIE